MLKWIGAGLVAALSLYIGLSLGAAERRRAEELRAFCRFLGSAEESIGTLRLPAEEIFLAYADGLLERNGFLPRLRAQVRRKGCGDALGAVIREMAKENRLALRDGDAAELLAFSAAFGTGDSTQEVRRCAYYRAHLMRLAEEAEAEAPGNVRIFRVLSVSAGILCILLLF